MLQSADKPKDAGAQGPICPDNTIHQALPHLKNPLPLPFLHIAEIVAESAAASGYSKLALTGTKWLVDVDSDVYPDVLKARSTDCVRPSAEEAVRMNDVIIDELVTGAISTKAEKYFQRVIARMEDEGNDAVMLGAAPRYLCFWTTAIRPCQP